MTDPVPATSRTTISVAVSVTLMLAVAIGVAMARNADTPPSAEKPGAAVEAPAQGGDGTGTPAPSVDGTVSAVPGIDAVGGDAPAPDGKTLPKPNPSAPKQPARDGSRLTTLPAPPERTIGMIVVPDDFRVATYEVTLKPFGWGPGGQKGGRLVASIVTATPADDGAKALAKEFKGRNATLWCQGPVAEAIELGGTYAGIMEVRKQGDVGVLYLTEVKAAK